MPKVHAKLSASSSHRWMACPGSIRLIEEAGLENVSSIYAEEGTAAHALAEICLTETKGEDGFLSPFDFIGTVVEGFEVTEEMAEAVNVYVEEIKKVYLSGPFTLHVEKEFSLEFVHKDMFGTNDACLSAQFEDLIIYDYKHGQGVAVDVVDNPQLAYYALGATEVFGDFCDVILRVVQPRATHKDGPIREWRISYEELRKLWIPKLKAAAEATEKPDAPLYDGGHCRWCPAAALCPKLHATALVEAQADFSGDTVKFPEPQALPIESITRILKHTDMIKSFLNSVSAYASSVLNSGGKIPGYKLVAKKSNRAWKNEAEVIAALAPIVGKEKLYLEPKIKSPAQVEKLLKKKDKEIVHHLAIKSDSGGIIAEESDARAEYRPSIETDFNAVEDLSFLD